jgi:hypothetical protein
MCGSGLCPSVNGTYYSGAMPQIFVTLDRSGGVAPEFYLVYPEGHSRFRTSGGTAVPK